MIVTILQSSPTFEAVNYNERKVAKGEATMLAIENFGYLESSKDFTSDDLRQYLNVSSTKSEQCKLCINSPLYIDTRLLWKQTIGSNGP